MKTLYLDCGMGAAGDMITAALLELLPDKESFVKKLNSLGIPGIVFEANTSVKCGIKGTHMSVKVNGQEEEPGVPAKAEEIMSHDKEDHHEQAHAHHSHKHVGEDGKEYVHEHHGMDQIKHIVADHLHVPDKVKKDILGVYGLLAEAENHVHGTTVDEIHFHEVGTMDAIADVTAVCMLINEISPDKIIASPVNTGSGTVKCAHGILPIPAPATAYLLQGIPSYSSGIKTELCTPTGAAILKYFADDFGEMPVMRTSAIGYGMGTKDLEWANCIRAMIGETEGKTDMITELMCTIDDMTPEAASFAVQKIIEGGALDVYTVPVSMKKGRTGLLFVTLCRPEERLKMAKLIFKHTTTIGIRWHDLDRFVLDREIEDVDTPYGIIRRKVSKGYGVERTKYEYDDLSRIADEKGISISEILKNIELGSPTNDQKR